jgi:hypothetical protein
VHEKLPLVPISLRGLNLEPLGQPGAGAEWLLLSGKLALKFVWSETFGGLFLDLIKVSDRQNLATSLRQPSTCSLHG